MAEPQYRTGTLQVRVGLRLGVVFVQLRKSLAGFYGIRVNDRLVSRDNLLAGVDVLLVRIDVRCIRSYVLLGGCQIDLARMGSSAES